MKGRALSYQCETAFQYLFGAIPRFYPHIIGINAIGHRLIRLIHFIRRMRKEHGIPVTFTIDAGPNIHMLYPKSAHVKIIELVQLEFSEYISQNRIIFDHIGLGPKRLI